MRLIDADAIVALLRQRSQTLKGIYGDIGGSCSGAAGLIGLAPTIDAVPVVHGRWQYHINANNEVNPEYAYCSKCGFYVDIIMTINFNRYRYCPCCGARMAGDDNE